MLTAVKSARLLKRQLATATSNNKRRYAPKAFTRSCALEVPDVLAKGILGEEEVKEEQEDRLASSLEPYQIYDKLNAHIVGQSDAKKAVAIAVRNRMRRHMLPKEMSKEIMPKNILMVGPTGVGKTEIARRIATLVDAPFVKVEATKFTEVGFKGRDVDSIIVDLLENGIVLMREMELKKHEKEIEEKTIDRIVELLVGEGNQSRDSLRAAIKNNTLTGVKVDYQPQEQNYGSIKSVGDFLTLVSKNNQRNKPAETKTKMSVAEAKRYIREEETDKLITRDTIIKKAIDAVQNDGIVFLDELDKICGNMVGFSADASAEGVQRDLLPLIEGTSIRTKHGVIDTSKILFVAAGAFHQSKPSDLLAELQGRLPIRVKLEPLKQEDLVRILTEPKFNMIEQHKSLLKTEKIDLQFNDEAIACIAKITYELNQQVQNTGARRLHTVLETLTQDISFDCHKHRGKSFLIDKKFCEETLKDMRKRSDLKQFIL